MTREQVKQIIEHVIAKVEVACRAGQVTPAEYEEQIRRVREHAEVLYRHIPEEE